MQITHRFYWLILGLGLSLGLLLGLGLAQPQWPTLPDQQQPRYDHAAPIPQSATELTQTLVPDHDGFTAIELLAVVYPEAPLTATLTLQLLDANQQVVAEQVVSGLKHNDPLRFEFPPLPHSAGQTYTLRFRGSAGNPTTAWAYHLDGYVEGALSVSEAGAPPTPQGDLYFSTFYKDSWASVLASIWAGWADILPWLPWFWLLGFVPGLLWLAWWPWPHLLTAGMRWGLALAFSLALLPLLWLWASVFGLAWRPLVLCFVYLGLAVVYLVHLAQRWSKHGWQPPDWPSVCLLGILIVSISLRWVAARDVVLPPWVDGSHHYAITQVLAAVGRIPGDYAPFYPIPRFVYHFAFHTLIASLNWFGTLTQPQNAASLAQLMLLVGQLLNGLQALAAYALTVSFTRRPWAGVGAALLLSCITYFPAYHLTWGRYSHLVGMVLLAAALASVWHYLARPTRTYLPLAIYTAVVASGLLLAHYPMFIIWVASCAVVFFFHLRRFWRWLWVTGCTLLLSAPWLWHLATDLGPRVVGRPSTLLNTTEENVFPTDYFAHQLDQVWIALALVGLLLAVLQRQKALSALALWLAGVAIVVNLGSGTWLVNNRILAISLFLPTAVSAGWLLVWVAQWAVRAVRRPAGLPPTAKPHWALWAKVKPSLGVLALSLCVGGLSYSVAKGVPQQMNILNPVTILVARNDTDALEWVAANTPTDAVFAINTWPWQGQTWAGGDGGAWVWPYTERRSTLPPSDYVYMPLAERQAINTLNQNISAITDANAPATLDLWRNAGITHIFIGQRGGSLKPELFMGSPNYTLLYSNGGAWVFAVGGP